MSRTPLRWTSWLPRRRYFIAGSVDAADLIPSRLPRRAAIVVVNGGRPAWIAFDCPCARRHRLMMNLDSRRKPNWRLGNARHLNLAPSIDAVDAGQRCHFWLQNGRVKWARSTRRLHEE